MGWESRETFVNGNLSKTASFNISPTDFHTNEVVFMATCTIRMQPNNLKFLGLFHRNLHANIGQIIVRLSIDRNTQYYVIFTY